ncbi:hypothetical protein Ga0061065_104269 [Marinomonas fungiae]|uniref:Uncharacterized protein n=1 Tax=Marinomonas fungiae TaxID=1137284 RepID=A0A0K6IL58_9GAMM|nr:hypothetical protein Ga0061065_104269 [Marinomonas fungiae]
MSFFANDSKKSNTLISFESSEHCLEWGDRQAPSTASRANPIIGFMAAGRDGPYKNALAVFHAFDSR